MTQLQLNRLMNPKKETLWSVAVFRRVGYGLLVLALFDLIATFVPLHLMNPIWQFETMGAIVDRVAIPLLGLVLVFWGEERFRLSIEQKLLRYLRKLCLIVGVLFFLLIPLGLVNTLQIKVLTNARLSEQYNLQNSQITRVEQRLSQVKAQELDNFIQRLAHTFDGQIPQLDREQFLVKFDKNRQQMQFLFEEAKASFHLTFFKNSIKLNLGALVVGILFIYIWHLTRWAV